MVLVILGLGLFVIHAAMYLFIQARLFGKGLLKSRWATIASSVRMYRTYIRVAEQNHWPPLIGYLAPILLISSLVLIFWGVMRSGQMR